MAISDTKRKKIIADRVAGCSIREIAKRHGVSTTTVHKHCKDDSELKHKLTQKQEENTQSVLEYMESQRETKKRIADKLLNAIEKKADNLDMFTNVKDLATAYGILIDKELKYEEIKKSKEGKIEPIEIILRRD